MSLKTIYQALKTKISPSQADLDRADKRIEVCNTCEFRVKEVEVCSKCSCWLPLKVFSPEGKGQCPENKWEE